MRARYYLAAIFVLAVSLWGCSEEQSYSEAPRPVRVHEVEQYSGSDGARYSAIIEPFEQVHLAFKVGGYVEDILQQPGADGRARDLQRGDRVTRGTVLARLRDTDYVEKVNQARSQLSQAEAAWVQARQDYQRASNLYETQVVSKGDHDAAKARFDASRAQVEGAKALLDESQIVLSDTSLRAPIDGTVLSRNVEVGTLVDPGTPGFLLADVTSVKAVFGVPDVTIGHMKLGDTLITTTESVRNVEFEGLITAISPSADPLSRVFEIELSIPNPDDSLKPGMITTVQLAATQSQGPELAASVIVPLSAVVRPTGKMEGYAVYVVEQAGGHEVARMQLIELGDMRGNDISVVAGLAPGQRVVITGATLLIDGDVVRVIPE